MKKLMVFLLLSYCSGITLFAQIVTQLNRDSIPIGYKYEVSFLNSIEANYVISFFIPNLKYTTYHQIDGTPNSYDAKGYSVIGSTLRVDGAWKNLTVLKKTLTKDYLQFVFADSCILKDGSVINSITFKPVSGYYIISGTSFVKGVVLPKPEIKLSVNGVKNPGDITLKKTKDEAPAKEIPTVESLIEDLKSEDLDIRRDAIISLGEFKDKRAMGPLIQALSGIEGYFLIIRSLKNIEPDWTQSEDARNVLPQLIPHLQNEKTEVHIAIAEILKEVKDPRAVEPLILSLNKGDWGGVFIDALDASDPNWMSTDAARNAVPMFIDMLNSEDCEIIKVAANVLGKINDERALEPLMRGLKNPKSYSYNHYALEKIDSLWYKSETASGLVTFFIEALHDPDWQVRNRVTIVLGTIGDMRAVDPLIETLLNDVAGNREVAARSLGCIKDRRAVDPLIKTMSDELWSTREISVWALGEIKDPRAINPLKKALKDENSIVQEEAAKALEKITGKKNDCP